MKSEAFRAMAKKVPVAFFTVGDPRAFTSMNRNLVHWIVRCVVVGVVAAFVAGRTLTPGAE